MILYEDLRYYRNSRRHRGHVIEMAIDTLVGLGVVASPSTLTTL